MSIGYFSPIPDGEEQGPVDNQAPEEITFEDLGPVFDILIGRTPFQRPSVPARGRHGTRRLIRMNGTKSIQDGWLLDDGRWVPDYNQADGHFPVEVVK